MFFKKLLVCMVISILLLSSPVFADGFYDLGSNCKKLNISGDEKKEYSDVASSFLVRVKNRQFNYLAENLLYIPETTYQKRPLTASEIKQIKDNFIKGLEKDFKYWKQAELAEIGKFEVTEPDYRNKTTKKSITYGIFLKTENCKYIEKTDHLNNKLIFAPIQLIPQRKGSKLLISGYYILIKGTYPAVPEYPDTVWPRDMD